MMVARIVFLGAAFCGFELMFLSYVVFLHHDPNGASVPADMRFVRWASTPNEANCSRPSNVSGNTLSPKTVNVTRNKDDDTFDIWFSTFLLILVPVRPQGIHPRQLIRDTWLQGFKNRTEDVVLKFVIGNRSLEPDKLFELSEENGTHGDIVFVNASENDVAALTNKTLALINWAHHHAKFSYWMKCDDDTYVFIQNLLDELRKRPTTTKLYFGKILVDSPIVRGTYKWADNDWNLAPVYLPFAMGGGYVVSHDLVAALSQQGPRLKWHINEDTAVGAWLSALEYERRSDDRFCFWWKGHSLEQCKQPFLALLLFGFSRDELVLHFNHYYKQVSSNISVTLLTPPPGAPTMPTAPPKDKSSRKQKEKSATEPTTELTESTTESTKKQTTKKPTTKSNSSHRRTIQLHKGTPSVKKVTKKPSSMPEIPDDKLV